MFLIQHEDQVLEQDDITYIYQDNPWPGGITIHVTLTGPHKKDFQKQVGSFDLASAHHSAKSGVLFWLSKKEAGKRVARYVLNRIDAIVATEEAVQLILTASPLLSAEDFRKP